MTAQETPATACRRHKGQFERGAVAVEMALVMPILILMVMGIIDFGRIFNGEIQLSQAAREGARITALGAPGNFDTTAVTTRAKAALTNPAFQGNPSLDCTPTTTNGCIVVEVVTSAGVFVRTGVCQTTDSTSNYGQVTITIPYNKILFGPISLSQTAVMKCSG